MQRSVLHRVLLAVVASSAIGACGEPPGRPRSAAGTTPVRTLPSAGAVVPADTALATPREEPPPVMPEEDPTEETPPSPACDPNYDGCVPIDTDVDCAGGSGNGPSYVAGPVRVIGRDIYRLDRDGDGVGCES